MSVTLKASWKKVAESDVLKRSSHAVAAIDGQVYVFGGEVVARQPRDGDVHAVAVAVGEGMLCSQATVSIDRE
jgi:N-acetylneuraminic acid mutarotase